MKGVSSAHPYQRKMPEGKSKVKRKIDVSSEKVASLLPAIPILSTESPPLLRSKSVRNLGELEGIENFRDALDAFSHGKKEKKTTSPTELSSDESSDVDSEEDDFQNLLFSLSASAGPAEAASVISELAHAEETEEVAIPMDFESFAQRAKNLISEGKMHAAIGEYQKALTCYATALNNDPQAIEAWIQSGNVGLQVRDFTNAALCFQKAITIDSGYTESYMKLAETAIALKNPLIALQCYTRVLELDPLHEGASEMLKAFG